MKPATLHERLPLLEVRVSVSDVVAMSIATRDFHPIHHDVERARSAGHPGLFLNMMSTSGLIERFARQWTGPAARLGRLKFRLGVPHYAGETLRLAGRVSAVGEQDGSPCADIEFEASNPRGIHASGQLRMIWS